MYIVLTQDSQTEMPRAENNTSFSPKVRWNLELDTSDQSIFDIQRCVNETQCIPSQWNIFKLNFAYDIKNCIKKEEKI